jgi:glutamate-1-semialdehyde 2,1-aminomutase
MDLIESALDEANAAFAARRPRTATLHERARRVMPGGNTRTVLYTQPFPVRVERAQGATVTDVDGHSYADFLGEYSAGIYGHSNPVLKQAVANALAQGINMGAQHVKELEFAEAVCARFGLDLVRFTNSGTEANMMAIAAARCFTKRDKIMPMYGGYHGGTLYYASGAAPVNAPFPYVLGKFNDVGATRKLIAEHGSELACVILEPMLGGGGCLAATAEFIAMLREESRKHGILLIFDEVMTSRLAPGGLSSVYGVEPDLKTLGKYVGGGMSFGAFGGRADIMSLFDPSRLDALPHAGTFNNNTLTMHAGLAGITRVYTPEACLALNARGDGLRGRINDLFMRYQAPLQAVGIGSMMTIHPLAGDVATPEQAQKADVRLKRLLFLHLLSEGVYIAERGFIALSLAVTDAEETKLLAGLESFVTRYKALLDGKTR